jgi:hypothetical protein
MSKIKGTMKSFVESSLTPGLRLEPSAEDICDSINEALKDILTVSGQVSTFVTALRRHVGRSDSVWPSDYLIGMMHCKDKIKVHQL